MNAVSATVFSALVAVTLGLTWRARSRTTSAAEHLVAGGSIPGAQNGVAIAGDYLSAVSFLGVTGAIALTGFNGYYLAVFVPVAYALTLLLVAEPMRNLGRYTPADVVAARFPGPRPRVAMAAATVLVNVFFLVGQFVGAAALVQLLFGLPYWFSAIVIGALTTIYTLFGGMLATTWIQIVKTVLLCACAIVLVLLTLSRFGFDPLAVFARARDVGGTAAVAPVRRSTAASIDQLSLIVGLVFGVIGLPHVLTRFLTVRDGRAARTSALVSIWIFSGFFLLLPVIGYGAALLVGTTAIRDRSAGGNLALPQLTSLLGGETLLAVVGAVAFATILAVLGGLIVSTTGAIAHDVYGTLLGRGAGNERRRLRAVRVSTLVMCVLATVLSLGAQRLNVAFLPALGTAVAASATLPALLFTLHARRMTDRGLVASMAAGGLSAVAIIVLSPVVLGAHAVVPISNPAIVSMPVGFAAGLVVAALTRPRGADRDEAERVFAAIGDAARNPHLRRTDVTDDVDATRPAPREPGAAAARPGPGPGAGQHGDRS